jgi:UDP-N-acetylglucosamine 2-epimerase (non-hydrolysing)
MSCAIVAKKLKIEVAHIEAGIRSLDRDMPEEINRLVTDSISDYFFTTSKFANDNLKKENIHESKIFFVGNTMIDSLKNNLNKLEKSELIEKNNISVKKYFLMTLHRPSNVDDLENLKTILSSVDEFVNGTKVVFPIHPRTQKKLSEINLKFKNIIITEPQKYLQFIDLINNSIGVITDSGGITEETTFLNIPCITLRDTTERPETVEEGTNILVGNNIEKLKNGIRDIMINNWKTGKIPELWDGKTSDRIIDHLLEIHKQKK